MDFDLIMNFLKKQFKNIFLVVTLILSYFNFLNWQKGWLGIILFLSYFYFLTPIWKDILRRLFGYDRRSQMLNVFSWFSIFLLLSFFSAVCLVFYKLTSIFIFFSYVLTVLVSFVVRQLVGKKRYKIDNLEPVFDDRASVVFKINFWLPALYFVFWFIAFIILWRTNGVEVYYSPWQIISKYYLPIFFGLTLLSGLFLLFKYKTKLVLLIFVLQAILLHSYLPLSHNLPWGGDVWRHVAVEDRLLSGGQVLPVLFGDNAKWVEKVGIDIPEVFVSPYQYSYSQLWGSSVLLAKTFSIDLLVINKWLVPILWSIIGTFILYRIGWMLFGAKRFGLWLVWLSFIPFSFQALGSLTLPVSLGYLTSFFGLMLWLEYLHSGYKKQRRLVYFFGFTMLFGYILHLVLFWFIILISKLFKLINKKIFGWGRGLSKIFLCVVGIFFIPVLEIIFKFSNLSSINWLNNIKQFIGQISGWFYTSLIRPHDILSGNIIFNHTPDYAFVGSIFTNSRWLVLIIMSIFILALGFFIWKNLIRKNYNFNLLLLAWLGLSLAGSYFIGWFILSGDRSLTRRLDMTLAMVFIIALLHGLSFIFSKFNWHKTFGKICLIVIVGVFAWFGTMTYASGPDMRVVDKSEYNVAQYIWDQQSKDVNVNCVLADTWVLLPLESFSQGKIIGGGFPIDYQFGQIEKNNLFNKFSENPEAIDLEKSFSLTGTNKCWYLEKLENLQEENIDKLNKIFASEPTEVSGFAVWGVGVEKNVKLD